MSAESDRPERDAIEEALARGKCPVRYRGTVEDGREVEVLAVVYPDDGPVLRVRELERSGPYDNVRAAGQFVVGERSAIRALQDAYDLASEYGLEEVEG